MIFLAIYFIMIVFTMSLLLALDDKSANNNLGHAFVMFGLAVFWPCVLGNIAGIIISRIKIED